MPMAIPTINFRQSLTPTALHGAQVYIFLNFRWFISWTFVAKVPIPTTPSEALSDTVFITSMVHGVVGIERIETCSAAGLAARARVHRHGQTTGLTPATGCSSISGTKRSARNSFPAVAT